MLQVDRERFVLISNIYMAIVQNLLNYGLSMIRINRI